MTYELNRCPFCGGEAKALWSGRGDVTGIHEIKCQGCEMLFRPYGWNNDKMIAAWNTRPDGGDSLREALENCVKALEKLKTGHGTIIAKHCWQPISQAKAALAAKDGE